MPRLSNHITNTTEFSMRGNLVLKKGSFLVCAVRPINQKCHKWPFKKVLLTLSLLPFPQDGVQPLLLVLCIFGHADKPLVLCSVVDLPAVCHRVVVAVIVRCEAKRNESANSFLTGEMGHHK